MWSNLSPRILGLVILGLLTYTAFDLYNSIESINWILFTTEAIWPAWLTLDCRTLCEEALQREL